MFVSTSITLWQSLSYLIHVFIETSCLNSCSERNNPAPDSLSWSDIFVNETLQNLSFAVIVDPKAELPMSFLKVNIRVFDNGSKIFKIFS